MIRVTLSGPGQAEIRYVGSTVTHLGNALIVDGQRLAQHTADGWWMDEHGSAWRRVNFEVLECVPSGA